MLELSRIIPRNVVKMVKIDRGVDNYMYLKKNIEAPKMAETLAIEKKKGADILIKTGLCSKSL